MKKPAVGESLAVMCESVNRRGGAYQRLVDQASPKMAVELQTDSLGLLKCSLY